MSPLSVSLVSDTTIWILRILLVGVVSWVLVRWPRAAGAGVIAWLRRVVAVLALTGLGTLNVLAPVNARYGWYPTVGDVVGAFSPGHLVSPGPTTGAPAEQAARRSVGPSPLAGLSTAPRAAMKLHLTPTASGGYETFTVTGPISHYTGPVTVWFPPAYTSPASTQEFPVLEGFHGFQPAPMVFFTAFGIDSVIADQVRTGQLRAPILVVPHWAATGLDSECVDGGAGNPAVETWLTRDVPAWVYTHFRVAADRGSWATIGGSAGGWCALMSTMLHPATYSAALSFGGYARPDFDSGYVPFGPNSPQAHRYDLVRMARDDPPSVALWVLSPMQDALAFPTSTPLTNAARAPLSATPIVLPTGGHRDDVWTPYLPQSLARLAHTASGFAP